MSKGLRYAIGGLLIVCVMFFLTQKQAWSAVKFRGFIKLDPMNLDPSQYTQEQDRLIGAQVLQGLVTFDYTKDPPYPIIPVLAESYEVSKDAKMVTFKLRKGVQFHGGYGELTSEDVVFSLQRHLDPKVASLQKSELADLEGMEAPDKYTVIIRLKNSSALTLMQNLAFQNLGYILSKKAVETLGSKVTRLPIGTGPFYYDQWLPGEKVTLKKFDKYWRTPAKIDEIELWVIPDQTVALGALEKGDLELAQLTEAGSYERAKRITNAYIEECKGGGGRIYIYYINFKMKPMDDVRVRRALAHALDLKGICARIGPMVKYFPSPLAPIVFGATDEFWKYEYDVSKAKKLLAEAGYPNGFELRLIYEKGDLFEPIALEVRDCWNKVVDVKLEMFDQSNFYDAMVKTRQQHVAAWGLARYAPFQFSQAYLTGSPRNYSQYSNPAVDEAIKKATTSATDQESMKYWREFQKLTTDDAFNYWVANGKSLCAIRNNVKSVVVMPTPGVYILEKAYVE